jgi:hypothetical protein
MSVNVQTEEYALGTSAGALAIKQKLIDLHKQALGESLQLGDDELEFSYRLLVETWEDRQTHENNDWAWDWPNENCHFYLRSQWDGENSVSSRAQDPSQMLYAWTSTLIYLMTDFYYLHE